jgi:hypothetical protein
VSAPPLFREEAMAYRAGTRAGADVLRLSTATAARPSALLGLLVAGALAYAVLAQRPRFVAAPALILGDATDRRLSAWLLLPDTTGPEVQPGRTLELQADGVDPVEGVVESLDDETSLSAAQRCRLEARGDGTPARIVRARVRRPEGWPVAPEGRPARARLTVGREPLLVALFPALRAPDRHAGR